MKVIPAVVVNGREISLCNEALHFQEDLIQVFDGRLRLTVYQILALLGVQTEYRGCDSYPPRLLISVQ